MSSSQERRVQPSAGLVNRSNRFTRGLRFLWTPNAGFGTEAVNAKVPANSGTGTRGIGPRGGNYTASAGSSHGLTFGLAAAPVSTASQNYTILCIAAPPAFGTRSWLFGYGDNASLPYAQVSLFANGSTGGNGSLELNEYDSTSKIIAHSASQVNGTLRTFVAVRNGSAAQLYVDGVPVTTSVSGGSSAATVTAGNTTVSGINGGTNASTFPTYLVAVWNRSLTAAEVAAVTANPWQLFAPIPRRNYFGVTAGGGGGSTIVRQMMQQGLYAGYGNAA